MELFRIVLQSESAFKQEFERSISGFIGNCMQIADKNVGVAQRTPRFASRTRSVKLKSKY